MAARAAANARLARPASRPTSQLAQPPLSGGTGGGEDGGGEAAREPASGEPASGAPASGASTSAGAGAGDGEARIVTGSLVAEARKPGSRKAPILTKAASGLI
ncbi:MAG TPA: hypothetical protein VK459_28110 [Polyangiaceae bacterium]|nr:hypothetical protein [Polyangiaceae bacterium]